MISVKHKNNWSENIRFDRFILFTEFTLRPTFPILFNERGIRFDFSEIIECNNIKKIPYKDFHFYSLFFDIYISTSIIFICNCSISKDPANLLNFISIPIFIQSWTQQQNYIISINNLFIDHYYYVCINSKYMHTTSIHDNPSQDVV